MRILKITNIAFGGIRQDRNTVSQLKQDNPYDLNVPNQRRINTAIEELSKVGGEDNVNFLLDVSENLKYGTNIDLGKRPYNDWRAKLNRAAEKSLQNSDKSVQEKLAKRIDEVVNAKRTYTPEEKEILVQRELLFDKIDREALSRIKNSNTRNLNRNLNYFIISSEVPTSQKLYILKKLNFLMSDDYKIHPQLVNRKTQVLAEIVNDIVVNTPESKVPNIKAINQKQHGMCGAISVSRKALAYEDKVNYVDMILSELDDTPYIQVYDRTKLGSKSKIPVPKANIDYDYALSKGYRIVDTSVMNWMNVGDTVGAFNDVIGAYKTFDKENFETFADSHIYNDIDKETEPKQDFYRALVKAKEVIGKYKKVVEKDKYLNSLKFDKMSEKLKMGYYDFKDLRLKLREIIPTADENEIRRLANNLISLNVKSSDDKLKADEKFKNFTFIDNESEILKTNKIKEFIKTTSQKPLNNKLLDKNANYILELVSDIKTQNHSDSVSQVQRFRNAQKLYEAAASYRTQQVFQLDIPEYLQALMQQYNIPDEETVIIDNLKFLSQKIRNGSINPVLKEKLFKGFESEISQCRDGDDAPETDEEILADVLDEYAQTVRLLMTSSADDFYASLLLKDRKYNLSNQLMALQVTILNGGNKDLLDDLAQDLGVKNNKYVLSKNIDKYAKILDDPNCTDEQYLEIYNKFGNKSQLRDLQTAFKTAHMMISEENEKYIKGFNLINGAPEDAPLETTKELYTVLAKGFNNMSFIIKTLQKTLQITDDNGEILNTADPKFLVLKKLENSGDLPTTEELETFRQHFNKYALLRYDDENSRLKFSQLPKDVTTFTKFEKETLKKYSKNINSWYSTVTRRLNDSYNDLKEPLEELNRDIGVKTGEYWLKEGESGMRSVDSAKILEHMTDRPYYVEKDGKVGIQKLKETPYALNSSTHVDHKEPAPHAQYVVDVKPVVVKNGDKTEVKDVILHDNTWGAAEHDNIWIDENGFERTDYSSGYGGELGFITDEDYHNGNLADNLFYKSGKFVPEDIESKKFKKLNIRDDEEYNYRMFNAFIVQGFHPKARSTVSDIKIHLLRPSDEYVDDLTRYANNMTRKELKSSMLRISTAGDSARAKYKKMIDDIIGTDNILNKGITSQADYDKLPDNNPLKLALEKAAIYMSYDEISSYRKFASDIASMSDIKNLKGFVRNDARKNFDYITAKNPEIIKYCVEESREEIVSLLKEFSKQNKIKLNPSTLIKVVNDMKHVNPKDFDGNIEHSFDIILENFDSAFRKNIGGNIPNLDTKMQDMKNDIYKIVKEKTVLTPKDLEEFTNENIPVKFLNWADRVFEPRSDEELIDILTNLRKMTTNEFNEKYNSTITDDDLGIKNISGYDVARMIRSENSTARKTFINSIFWEEYYKDVNAAKTTPCFDYTKLSRKHSGGSYKYNKRTFDDIYIEYFNNLEMLTIGKLFAQNKDQAYKKYGVFPAYPSVELVSDTKMNTQLDTIYSKIDNFMASVAAFEVTLNKIDKITKLKNYYNTKLPESGELTVSQYRRSRRILKKILDGNETDSLYGEAVKQFNDLLASRSRSIEDFRRVVNFAWDRYDAYSYTMDGKTLKEARDSRLDDIETVKSYYIRSMFEPKYQSKAYVILNKWISSKMKAVDSGSNDDFMAADAVYEKFRELFRKHSIYSTPEKLLNEYLLLCAKDTNTKTLNIPQPDSEDSKEGFRILKDTYKSALESMLYKADWVEMQQVLMDCAEKGNLIAVRNEFKNSKLDLKDGSVVPLDSEKALKPLLSTLYAEDRLDTALLFINQLGLAETIVNIITTDPPFEQAYKNSAKIERILKHLDAQVGYVGEELKKLGNLDNSPDYKEKIEQFRYNIVEKAKRTHYTKTVEGYNNAIKEAYELFEKFPNMSKNFILTSTVEAAVQDIRDDVKETIDDLNTPMKYLQTRTKLMEHLIVPDNSECVPVCRKYFEDYAKLVDYVQSRQSDFPNLGMYQE